MFRKRLVQLSTQSFRFGLVKFLPVLTIVLVGVMLVLGFLRFDSVDSRPAPIGIADSPLPTGTKVIPAYTLFAPGTPLEVIAEFAEKHPEMVGGRREGDNFFQFDDGDRWFTTATNGPGLSQGDPTTLTWSIVPNDTFIPGFAGEPDSVSDLIAWLDGIYGSGSGGSDLTQRPWFPLFEQVFDRWTELTGVTYVYEPNDDGAAYSDLFFDPAPGQLGVRGDVRIGGHFIDGNAGILAYNFFPDSGDMVIDTADSFFAFTGGNSLGLRNVLSHEHGHGLGISHVCPLIETKLMEPIATFAFDGPQLDDILAANRGYGDYFEPNDTSATAHSLGALSSGVNTVNDIISIDDNSDTDFFSFSISGSKEISLTVSPSGTVYLSGPAVGQCNTGSSFNAAAQNDLAVEILDSDGSTVLSSADANGLGETETISDVRLPGTGIYYIKISGDQNAVQLYTMNLTINVDGPDVAINKSVSSAFALPGETITYTVNFSNDGTQIANNVVITDIVPVTLTNIVSTSKGVTLTTIPGDNFVWDAGDLDVGEGGTITLTGVISPNVMTGTVFFNTADISTTGTDVDLINNLAGPVKVTADEPPTIYLPMVIKN